MKNRIIAVLFVIAIAAIALFVIHEQYFSVEKKETAVSKIVIPQVQKQVEDETQEELQIGTEEGVSSLVPLKSDETLFGTLSMDFDGDGYDDQVNAIKNSSSPAMQLLVGLYNPVSKAYERSALIVTDIQQARTFSYTGMDITGDHRTALVYQGFLENGDSVMQVYHILRSSASSAPVLKRIASLRADGTIFIQQIERDDSYLSDQTTGASYVIWVYGSDYANKESSDQLQTRWEWNRNSQLYEIREQERITGNLIAARELAKIQDGTVATFANFLEGLWYKTENRGSQVHYIFFDWNEDRQIVFLDGGEEGVFDWHNSNVRRNGMYISTTNLEIENLQRRIDISLISKDQIRIHVQDDVRMYFSESSVWDGYYKKVNFASKLTKKEGGEDQSAKKFLEELEKASSWKTVDGTVFKFSDGNYNAIGDSINDNGMYSSIQMSGQAFIQFRSFTATPLLSGIYLLERSPVDGVEEEGAIILRPYVLTPSSCYPSRDKMLVLQNND